MRVLVVPWVRWAIAAVAALAGSAAGEVRERVATAADVRAICDSLRAAAPAGEGRRIYVVTLPASAFALGAYDTASAKVRIDGRRGFRGAGFELVLHHIAGADTRVDGALELAFPATSAEEADLRAAHLAGTLELALWFQPAQPRDGSAVCAEVRSTRGDSVRLAIEPLAFELSRRGERVASGESARFAALAEPGPVVAPRVVVAAPVLTHENARAPEKVKRAALALGPRLVACYRLGLAAAPSLRGSFVAGVDLGADGRVKTARAEIDGLGAPEVSACVLQTVRAARFPSGAERLSIPMQFTD